MFVLLSIVFGFTLSHGFYYDFDYFSRAGYPKVNLDQTFFSSLGNYEVNATPVSEAKYPWIAKVVHSITADVPYMCTASCIKARVFITAARCIIDLKVKHTSVIYQNKHQLPAQVFVLPSKGTKQGYDDIGFIVVKLSQGVEWKEVQLYNIINRTDEDYQWFKKLPTEGFMAVGYATRQDIYRLKSERIPFNLTELKVNIGLDICAKILTDNMKEVFHVPCYHSCSVAQFHKRAPSCNNYHGVEGGAIIETKSKKLLGIVTWGIMYGNDFQLPSGFSVVNSVNFFKDYKCAIVIVSDKSMHNEPLYWQNLCDKL